MESKENKSKCNQSKVNDIKKIVNIGSIDIDGLRAGIFCSVKIKNDTLHISGVIGPKYNGDAIGSCGQIDMDFQHRNQKGTDLITPDQIAFNSDWNSETWFDFLDLWKNWHLNDMKPSCEHQEALGWSDQASEEVTFYNWSLNSETLSRQNDIKTKSDEALKKRGHVILNKIDQMILRLEYILTTNEPDLTGSNLFYYVPCKGSYINHTETKTRGWLDIKENEKGLIGKPCPVCMYRYGTSWKKRDLTNKVIQQVKDLPLSKQIPAWV